MSNEIWIIEAPGKRRYLEQSLKSMGRDAFVICTGGHLFRYPQREKGKPAPVVIDKNFNDFGRVPLDIKVLARIRQAVRLCPTVIVATDADSEGDVIAWDVAELIKDLTTDIVRVPLKGMDVGSIKEAILTQKPVDQADAVPGRTRRIIDWLIGSAFSDRGVPVGRIGTAVLGMIDAERPTTLTIRLAAPASDGGSPWIAQAPVKGDISEEAARKIITLDLPALSPFATLEKTFKPSHMGNIMIEAAETLGLTPSQTAQAMQASYEAARLSYPRSSSNGMSRAAALKMKSAMAKAGRRADITLLTTKKQSDTHDSPYPIGDINLALDPTKMSTEEGTRALIARSIARASMRHKYQKAKGELVEKYLLGKGIPAPAARAIGSLEWSRDLGNTIPGQKRWVHSEIYQRRADVVLLEVALNYDLGKPSTWGAHIESFLSKGLAGDDLSLTTKGLDWIKRSPEGLLRPHLSAQIEKACETVTPDLFKKPGRTPWQTSVAKILRDLPLDMADKMRATVAKHPVQASEDFRGEADKVQTLTSKEDTAALTRRTKGVAPITSSGMPSSLPDYPSEKDAPSVLGLSL
ncbi:toprim domain-containing protein [Acetobacter persici]|uniref:Toprim domain-containing protein n=1 Tax=Acetobacter persici TaxID=1076596 RepID=A0A1U9LJ01_9PROT|nr:toprim domain-containing protein [Acetobacter persici]AQT06433.1 hypothetical protein A0U91_15580 [Acetobacter persici]